MERLSFVQELAILRRGRHRPLVYRVRDFLPRSKRGLHDCGDPFWLADKKRAGLLPWLCKFIKKPELRLICEMGSDLVRMLQCRWCEQDYEVGWQTVRACFRCGKWSHEVEHHVLYTATRDELDCWLSPPTAPGLIASAGMSGLRSIRAGSREAIYLGVTLE